MMPYLRVAISNGICSERRRTAADALQAKAGITVSPKRRIELLMLSWPR
jgi:hypothetical protein